MKELDFDELDRAVNTLMGGVTPAAPSPRVDDDARVITIPSTIDDKPTPVMPRFTSPNRTTTPDEAPVRDVADTSTPQDAVAPAVAERADTTDQSASRLAIPSRRAGRFMDVVHPSSDMKNPSNAPSERPSRTAASIAPLAADSDATPEASTYEYQAEPTAVPYPAITEPDTVASVTPQAVASVAVEAPIATASTEASSEWPDPLAGFDAAVTTTTATVTDDEEGDDDLFTIDTTEPDDEPQPLVSPFLTDAKVEKRPLGAAATDDNEPGRVPVLGALAEVTMTDSNPDDQLPPEPTEIEQPLPAELQGDLMAVESDHGDVEASEQSVVAQTPELVAATVPTQQAPEVQPAVAAVGPSSIQQQYKESAETGDQTNGSIYDTQAYHQPLAHPVKKKSGWMWVIWVLLLLVVGAGGAVALYLLEII